MKINNKEKKLLIFLITEKLLLKEIWKQELSLSNVLNLLDRLEDN